MLQIKALEVVEEGLDSREKWVGTIKKYMPWKSLEE